ncbi:unnamed protein product, partial [Rotaria magnacalcarata]
NYCRFEFTKQEQQFQTCPFKELSFEHIESRLKELVDRERKYLSKRNNDKLMKFKEDISEKQLLKTISTASFMKNQPITLSQLKINDEDGPNENSNPFAIKRKRFILTPTPTTESRSILDKPCSSSIGLQHNSKKSKTTRTLTTAASSNISSPI